MAINPKFYFGIFIIPLILMLLPLGSCLFPKSHAYIIFSACKSEYTTELASMCCENVPACIAGNTLADISVIYYLENGLKKYTVTHSDLLCTNAIRDAGNDKGKQAFASGICLHATGADRVSHNIMVPYSIEHTGLPNVIIHPFAEQKIDDYILALDPQANKYLDDAMGVAPQYAQFFKEELQPNPEYENIDINGLISGFLQQVRNSNSGYDVSFETLKAVPMEIYFWIFGVFIFSIIGMLLILFKTRMTWATIISFIILLFVALLVIATVIATYTGTLWITFVKIAKPIGVIVPTQNPSQIVQQAIQETDNLFQFGLPYRDTLPDSMKDITGVGTPAHPGPILIAEQHTMAIRWVYYGIIIALVLFFGYFCWRHRKSKKRKGLGL